MSARIPHFVRSLSSRKHVAEDVRRHWDAAYGPLLASQLEPSRRYSIVKIGNAEFAYTRYDHFVEALARAWKLGLVPEPRPSAFGRELPEAAPRLRGVDSDLSGVDAELAAPVELA